MFLVERTTEHTHKGVYRTGPTGLGQQQQHQEGLQKMQGWRLPRGSTAKSCFETAAVKHALAAEQRWGSGSGLG